jgi:hypothetical protein
VLLTASYCFLIIYTNIKNTVSRSTVLQMYAKKRTFSRLSQKMFSKVDCGVVCRTAVRQGLVAVLYVGAICVVRWGIESINL